MNVKILLLLINMHYSLAVAKAVARSCLKWLLIHQLIKKKNEEQFNLTYGLCWINELKIFVG